MFRVLVVDDDETCLNLLKACLEKWNYQVTTVKHALDALDMLRMKSFDLVFSDVHMPDINGFELLRQVDQEFKLPVILISADTSREVMWMGVKNGAQHFMVKPIRANDVKDIWQYSFWWKITKPNITAPVTQINNITDGDALSFATISTTGDDTVGRRNKKVLWTSDLHSRFVEAILVIGYQEAVPANISEVMNVPGLTGRQIASHLQKYQMFLQRVLDGKTNIEFSKWVDLNYCSSFVSGNPDLLLINQLREEQRNGKLAAHNPLRPPKQPYITTKVRAPNGSSSSSRYKPLPPYNKDDASSLNVGSSGMTSANLPNTHSEKMRGIVESNTFNSIHNLGYNANHKGYYNQNTQAQEQNTFCQQSFNVSEQGNNNLDYGNNFNTDQQLGGEQISDGSWFNNNGLTSADSNIIQ